MAPSSLGTDLTLDTLVIGVLFSWFLMDLSPVELTISFSVARIHLDIPAEKPKPDGIKSSAGLLSNLDAIARVVQRAVCRKSRRIDGQ